MFLFSTTLLFHNSHPHTNQNLTLGEIDPSLKDDLRPVSFEAFPA
jgi:hypothetical protein